MQEDKKILPHVELIDNRVFILRSNDYLSSHLVALGMDDEFVLEESGNLEDLDKWIKQKEDWIFGYLSYDLKNKIEKLETRHPNKTGVNLAHFICPKAVFSVDEAGVHIYKSLPECDESFILSWVKKFLSLKEESTLETIDLIAAQNKEHYLKSVYQLKNHIHSGDIYEINYCQEFYSNQKLKSPFNTWMRLNEKTTAPFAAYFQINDLYLLCGSPERYLKRLGTRVTSQPIKGTIRRSSDATRDQELKDELHESLKERTENVMIVDLVRNDLSRSAERGSVKVDKQFELITFKTVHHLVSTISAQIKSEVSFVDLIKDTFPMGSMTGAPKIKALQLSDQYESSARGIYSGSVGYIEPNGNFDFNVVIRTVVYNSSEQYISSHVGGAITAMCDPEEEYDECLLKIRAVVEALGR